MHSEDRSHSGDYYRRGSQSFKARSQSRPYQNGNAAHSESFHPVLSTPNSPEELTAQPSEKKLEHAESQSTQPSGSTSDTPEDQSGSNDDSADLDIIPSIPESERLNLKYEAVSCWVPNNIGSVSLFEGLKPNLGFLGIGKKKDSKSKEEGGKAPSSRQVGL